MSEHTLQAARTTASGGAAIQDSRGFSNRGLKRGASTNTPAPSRGAACALTTTAVEFILDSALLNTGTGGNAQRIKLDGGAVAIRVSRHAQADTDDSGAYDLVAANASGEFPISDVSSLWIRADSGTATLAYTIYYT